MKKNIAIIGAGMSGLAAAHYLQKDTNITIFEKSRGVGGRMASRTRNGYRFDFGAQFFTIKDKRFQKFVDEIGVCTAWGARFAEIDNTKIIRKTNWDDEYIHYVPTPSMNQLCKEVVKHCNKNVRLQLESKIISVNYEPLQKKWQITSQDGNINLFDSLVCSAPYEQMIELIPEIFINKMQIKKRKMQSCYALMIGNEEQLDFGFDAALIKNSNLSWMSINSSKPGRAKEFTLVALATNQWADEHIEKDAAYVKNSMLASIREITNHDFSDAKHIDLHKWRYANINKQNNAQCYHDEDTNLFLCGDWCIQGRIEAAYISGLEAAQLIKDSL